MILFTNIKILFESLSFESNWAFFISFVLLLISYTLFLHRQKHSITFLFLGGISLGFGFALIDPYLNIWDEKFHALVAKNLSETPFHPRLINSEIVNYNYQIWIENYTWLHKPPMALWQIALSIKLFGTSVLAVRIPSIILHALTAILVYRIGLSVFTKRIAYFASLVYLLLSYNLELLAGIHTSDHIDVTFTFYIIASLWAFIEYQKTRKAKWIYLIGGFVGLAILTKWLVGLLVFSGWGIYLIVYCKDNTLIEWKRLLVAFIIAIAISAPWFIYAYIKFPIEYQHEINYNLLHFTSVIENHGGDTFFYWNNLNTLFGNGFLIPWLFILSFFLLWKTVNDKKYALQFYVWIGIVYLFFSLAGTKMTSFVLIVSPLLVLALVSLVAKGINLITSRFNFNRYILCVLYGILFVFLIIGLLRPHTVYLNHSLDDPAKRNQRLMQKNFIKNNIPGEPKDIYFFEETRYFTHIDLMFYHSSTAINRLPSEEEITMLLKKGYTVYVLYINNEPKLDIKNSKLKYLKLFGE